MRIDILTLFPDFFLSPLNSSILKRAREQDIISFHLTDIRDFTEDKHRKADDRPFGGGCGMVMKAEPVFRAVDSLTRTSASKIILMCPTGTKYSQEKATELSASEHLVLICGHYEGIDERVRKYLITDEISMGDYVLTGGEIPALTVIDSVARLLPGVLGNDQSAQQDSFSDGLLDCPHYTRPSSFNGWDVPEILLSGDHSRIADWRLKEKLRLTYQRRPDLLEKAVLDKKAKKFLDEIRRELTP
jgi:tRNA (guanine37-N1)-methyltransferase